MPEPTEYRLEGVDDQPEPITAKSREQMLVEWCMRYVQPWREQRDQAFKDLNEEYYRLYRGRWVKADKDKQSQRSRIVTPALAQALDMTVSELEEATFGREQWVDFLDDDGDPDQEDIMGLRRRFLEDMHADGVPSAISQCYLNGGLWGTMAAKVSVEQTTEKTFLPAKPRDPVSGAPATQATVEEEPAVKVPVIPIPWNELITDPEAEWADDGLATIHEVRKTRSWLRKYDWGRDYASKAAQVPDDDPTESTNTGDPEELTKTERENSVKITEWHGLVPARLLAKPRDGDFLTAALAEAANPKDDATTLVEAIVTIADEKHLLRAMANPFVMKDRSIVVCPFEKVPGRLNGRGVMEKGYNGQKALDAEVRTRIDVMALVANPMMGADNTALPRGFDLRVRPGKVWLTNGPPGQALHPISFQGLDPNSFNQSAEMERMVQMGTGAMDTATPLRENRRNETATGTSLIAGTFVKRSKRALGNITRDFIEPLVQKVLWRRMQYDPARYPADLKFRVVGTLGIVARELEQSQLQNAASIAPQGSPLQLMLLKAYFENTSSPNKAELVDAVDQMLTPDPEQQEMAKVMAQLELAEKRGKVLQLSADTKAKEANAVLSIAKAQKELSETGIANAELELEFGRLQKEFGELREFSRQNDIALLNVLKPQNAGKSEGE